MGLLSTLFRRREAKALSSSPVVLEALRSRTWNPYPVLGGTNTQAVSSAYQRGIDATYGWIYATQPAVRSVIDYVATNVAQLSLWLYEISDEYERSRAEDHPAAQSVRHPNPQTTEKSFIYTLVTDYMIWDNAYFVKFGAGNDRLVFERVNPAQVTVQGGRFRADTYYFFREDGSWLPVPPDALFHLKGYNPSDPLLGLSKLATLREELASDAAISAALVDLAKSGLKGGHIQRPVDAPEWTPEDRERFLELFKRAKADPQGTPILDEGMVFQQDSISPKDAQVISARQFTREEVARVYGMESFPPQSEEQRMQFYSDVLAPLTTHFAAQLDLDVVQAEYQTTDYCFGFDLNEKAYNDPWRLWSIFTSAAGAPFLTRDEVRNLIGLPAHGGDSDKLIVPSNVILEGESSPSLPAPNVMPIQDPNAPAQDGSYRRDGQQVNPQKALDEEEWKRNWVDEQGGLPNYIKRIAKHLIEKGMTQSHAIAVAVNVAKRMCASGDTNFPGVQQVNAGSRAEACAAVAQWEAMKVRAHASSVNGESKEVWLPRRHAQAARRDKWAKEYEGVLAKHFERQERATKSATGLKGVSAQHWDDELAHDMGEISRRQFAAEGKKQGQRLMTPFDPRYGQNYLKAKADRSSQDINEQTQKAIAAAGALAAFETAKNARAPSGGLGYATDVAAFAAKVAVELAVLGEVEALTGHVEEVGGAVGALTRLGAAPRFVTVANGDCEVCAPFQGVWTLKSLPSWPSYHPGCDCVVDPG